MAEAVDSLSNLKELNVTAAPAQAPATPKIDKQGRAYGTGRRKTATARVWIKRGTGKITVNGKDQEQYFARPVLRLMIKQPLEAAKRETEIDVECTVAVRASPARPAPSVTASPAPSSTSSRNCAPRCAPASS